MINELASEPDIYGIIAGVSYEYGGSVGNMTVQFNFTYNEIQAPNESASTIEVMKSGFAPVWVSIVAIEDCFGNVEAVFVSKSELYDK